MKVATTVPSPPPNTCNADFESVVENFLFYAFDPLRFSAMVQMVGMTLPPETEIY